MKKHEIIISLWLTIELKVDLVAASQDPILFWDMTGP